MVRWHGASAKPFLGLEGKEQASQHILRWAQAVRFWRGGVACVARFQQPTGFGHHHSSRPGPPTRGMRPGSESGLGQVGQIGHQSDQGVLIWLAPSAAGGGVRRTAASRSRALRAERGVGRLPDRWPAVAPGRRLPRRPDRRPARAGPAASGPAGRLVFQSSGSVMLAKIPSRRASNSWRLAEMAPVPATIWLLESCSARVTSRGIGSVRIVS